MEDTLKLALNQKQLQTLSPMQLQFVRVLEMTGPEIEDEVRRVLDENPALEIADAPVAETEEEEQFTESAEQLQLADYGSEDDIPAYRLEMRNHSADDAYYEPVAVAGESIIEALQRQLAEYDLNAVDMQIASLITGNIDDNGYMTRSPAEIADDAAFQHGLDVSGDEVKRVWQLVRSMEPAGIAAVDLRDCLLLQLKRRDDASSPSVQMATAIVGDYFDLFSKMRYDKLQSALGVGDDKLREAMEVIRSLNPKPGNQLSSAGDDERMRHITPDFAVECDGDMLTVTSLSRIPHLQIESSFAGDIKVPRRGDEDAASFVRQRRDEAQTFIKVLDMRSSTMFRVVSAIVKLQRQFFMTGDTAKLRPMVLRDVAALTGDDLSVISRATTGKYISAPSGIYPLKFFFNERPVEGADASSHELMAVLKSIIENEDKKHPLSDRAITALMNEKGYDVARRTVAKYREKAGIPVGRLRRNI